MTRLEGIEAIREVLAKLPADATRWPEASSGFNEPGCILQQACGDQAPLQKDLDDGRALDPESLGRVLGLTAAEAICIAIAYDRATTMRNPQYAIDLRRLVEELA